MRTNASAARHNQGLFVCPLAAIPMSGRSGTESGSRCPRMWRD